jgi:isopentenyl-diphosphate delta-isomerase
LTAHTPAGPQTELVVLLDDHGNPVGAAAKNTVHGTDTPLHLAFSCHLLRQDGRVLVTRRSLTKRTWPGVWTNSFCGHPLPGESLSHAIERRALNELGVTVRDAEPVLPDFRYRAIDASGVVENEICPVFRAWTDDPVRPNPSEVMDHAWVDPDELRRTVSTAPWALSPWLVQHAPQLPRLGGGTTS